MQLIGTLLLLVQAQKLLKTAHKKGVKETHVMRLYICFYCRDTSHVSPVIFLLRAELILFRAHPKFLFKG